MAVRGRVRPEEPRLRAHVSTSRSPTTTGAGGAVCAAALRSRACTLATTSRGLNGLPT